MEKSYNVQSNIGKAKHAVNFHDGVKIHRDGSPFFDIAIFRNKKLRDEFVGRLKRDGYTPA